MIDFRQILGNDYPDKKDKLRAKYQFREIWRKTGLQKSQILILFSGSGTVKGLESLLAAYGKKIKIEDAD